jgi:hypothetical protein
MKIYSFSKTVLADIPTQVGIYPKISDLYPGKIYCLRSINPSPYNKK